MSKEKRTAKLEDTAHAAFCGPCISVMIPARNEAAQLPRLLQKLKTMPEVREIVVCDGESGDETTQIAREMGARVALGARGRGPQQNAGAALAQGEILWFLHADSLPDPKSGRQICRASRNGVLGGNFRMHFEARGFWPRLFEAVARLQRGFGVYYGDSGIWLTREAWEQLGGFEAWPLFEDLDLARRLERLARREGQKTACLAGRLRVSARRFEKSPWRILGWWLGLQIGFELGLSPERLAAFYYGK